METIPPEDAVRRPPGRTRLSLPAAMLLAISFGLCGGYLDLGAILFKKTFLNEEGSFRSPADFPWTVPLGHVVLMVIPVLVVAAVNRFGKRPVSVRTGAWLFASVALWAALLRLPLYGICSLILAIGLGRLIAAHITARELQVRRLRFILASLLGVLAILAALSSGRQALREYRAVAGAPPAPSGARNVVLIVWDTVRAYNVTLNRYPRNTTPNLARWSRKGVRYNLALAPAPWTYPSHCSFFTGQWPFRLNSQWKFRLDTPDPTLAEYLAARGYQTTGFAANTNCCNYETGLARGFAHFEDYALTPRSLLSRTVPGKWMLENVLSFGDYYDQKWISIQSRGARELNDAFLAWLGKRRKDRPFFAFLNYFDAHDPYVPPAGYEGRFGIRPESTQDYRYLMDYVGTIKDPKEMRKLKMARDCYDDCIAFLDDQLGRLLGELQRQGLLENTDVIITSDHGEGFGDHTIFGHSYGAHLDEIGVPLVILSPRAPAGKVVYDPVSLCDLPATAVDMLGLSAGSPFPGHSLAAYWSLPAGEAPEITTPALTEQAGPGAFQPQPGSSRGHAGFQMSLVAFGYHYIRHGLGTEHLYHLPEDPVERFDLMELPSGNQTVGLFRKLLLEALTKNPGSAEVEKTYLEDFRQTLKALVHGPGPTLTTSNAR
jgi:arylsulfatase A-like enzyme